MAKYVLSFIGSLIFSKICLAFPCYFTAAKAPCWLDYEVTINVTDTATSKLVTKAIIPKGKLWERTEFNCTPGQQVGFTATFSPPVWEMNKDKVYRGLY